MTNLEQKKSASDLAYTTVSQSLIQLDEAIAAKAAELALSDAQYTSFKQSVSNFRQQYSQALKQDAQAAAQPKPATPTAAATPTPTPATAA